MNTSMNLTAIKMAVAIAERLGAKLPKDALADHDKLRALVDKANAFERRLGNNTGHAVLAALEADADPLTDPAVVTAVVRRSLDTTRQGLRNAVGERTGRYIDDHAVAILAALAPTFDKAATEIVAAREHLGELDLEDPNTIAKRGPKAAAAWAEVRAGEDVIAQILRLWKMLATVAQAVPNIDKRYRSLAFAEIPADVYVDEGLATVHVTPWMAAQRDWPLSLATPTTYRERCDTISQELADRRDEREDAFRKSYQQTHGMGAVA